jgi:HAD superfamily hydrolase (TIGR01549 family)
LLAKNSGKILAIIWDYDGTLVDSRQKNLNVTRKIVSKILKGDPSQIPALSSLTKYHQAHIKATNWREFYTESFGFDENQTDEAGRMWTGYQLTDKTSIPFIEGIKEVVIELGGLPQGIVSQNSKSIITKYLEENNLLSYFQEIIGYEQVDLKRQKPYPDGLIMCIDRLTNSGSGYILYIGDHETDVRCALNANNILSETNPEIKIISIGAFSGFDVDTSDWGVLPDYQVENASDIKSIINNFNVASR